MGCISGPTVISVSLASTLTRLWGVKDTACKQAEKRTWQAFALRMTEGVWSPEAGNDMVNLACVAYHPQPGSAQRCWCSQVVTSQDSQMALVRFGTDLSISNSLNLILLWVKSGIIQNSWLWFHINNISTICQYLHQLFWYQRPGHPTWWWHVELQRSHVSTVSGWHVFFCCLKIIAYMKLICIIIILHLLCIYIRWYPLIFLFFCLQDGLKVFFFGKKWWKDTWVFFVIPNMLTSSTDTGTERGETQILRKQFEQE